MSGLKHRSAILASALTICGLAATAGQAPPPAQPGSPVVHRFDFGPGAVAPLYQQVLPATVYTYYPAGSFPGQTAGLKDDSHFSAYGAYELATAVVEGIKEALKWRSKKYKW